MSPDAILDDAALWQRIRQGDEAAFGQLYRDHAPPLFRFATRLTGSAALAEDVLQDVFVGLMDATARRGGGGYDPARGDLRSYLFGAVRNAARKRLRDPGARPAAPGDGVAVGRRTDDDSQALRAALLRLEPDFREVVLLCELEGLLYQEAAAALGIPVGTVRSRLHRARARLVALLSDDPPGQPGSLHVREEAR
jgi:RNA polymerase sigma-70 factor, ECF subfamily